MDQWVGFGEMRPKSTDVSDNRQTNDRASDAIDFSERACTLFSIAIGILWSDFLYTGSRAKPADAIFTHAVVSNEPASTFVNQSAFLVTCAFCWHLLPQGNTG